MRPLAYLLGSRAIDVAAESTPSARRIGDEPLPPIATTPETAAAWRAWADAGRSSADSSAGSRMAVRPLGATPEPA